MSKVEIQGDVGQVFAGDVQQVHIHYRHELPRLHGWGLLILWLLALVVFAEGLLLIYTGVV